VTWNQEWQNQEFEQIYKTYLGNMKIVFGIDVVLDNAEATDSPVDPWPISLMQLPWREEEEGAIAVNVHQEADDLLERVQVINDMIERSRHFCQVHRLATSQGQPRSDL
jgi:hypothetical protein